MKRWIIVDRETLAIVSEYRFASNSLGTGMFGGSWDDSAKVMHLMVPVALKDVSANELAVVFEDPGQQVDDCQCPLFNIVPVSEVLDAFDSNGLPIIGSDGKQVKLQKFYCEPRMGPVHRIVRR